MKPIKISDAQLAFPASVKAMMPSRIPEDFKRGGTPWNKLFSDAFYRGLSSLELIPKEGIDPATAWRHVRAIMGSFEPKHEDKEAACAFLLSHWFKAAQWTPKGGVLQTIADGSKTTPEVTP